MAQGRLLAATLTGLVAGAAGGTPTARLSNGVDMPMLAAGTWQYNDTQAEAAVLAAVQAGFTLIDTAHDYNNQVGVGRGIRKSGADRKKLFIETKVPGCGMDPAMSMRDCHNDTKKILEKNLEELGLEYVDLVIVHFPPLVAFVTRSCRLVCGQVSEQWRAMEDFYQAGKARAIGVSNFCPSCFGCLDGKAQVYPMVNQVQYHIGMGPDPEGFRTFADKKGIALQAYSPLGNKPFKHGPDDEILHGNFTSTLAASHGKSTIQVALKWLVQHGVPTVTKSSNPDHLAQDLDLWSWNLTDEEVSRADAYKTSGKPSFACSSEEVRHDQELVV